VKRRAFRVLAGGLAVLSACVRDVPEPEVRAGARGTTRPSAATSTAAAASTAADAWLASADSALRVYLARQPFLEDGSLPLGFRDCSDDAGSDNPTLQAAAVALRPLGHSGAGRDSSSEYPLVVRRTTFSVEVKSVAIMVPQWIARFPVDSGPRDSEEMYAGVIAPRVDTFSIALSQVLGYVQRPDAPPDTDPPDVRWTVCDPGGPAVSDGDGPGFWGFAHARSRWMDIRHWTPADGTWERIVALADSAHRANDALSSRRSPTP